MTYPREGFLGGQNPLPKYYYFIILLATALLTRQYYFTSHLVHVLCFMYLPLRLKYKLCACGVTREIRGERERVRRTLPNERISIDFFFNFQYRKKENVSPRSDFRNFNHRSRNPNLIFGFVFYNNRWFISYSASFSNQASRKFHILWFWFSIRIT